MNDKSWMLKAICRTHKESARAIFVEALICMWPLTSQKSRRHCPEDLSLTERKQLEAELGTSCFSLVGVRCLYTAVLVSPVQSSPVQSIVQSSPESRFCRDPVLQAHNQNNYYMCGVCLQRIDNKSKSTHSISWMDNDDAMLHVHPCTPLIEVS